HRRFTQSLTVHRLVLLTVELLQRSHPRRALRDVPYRIARWRQVGSLRIGTLWESLAIPELRGQAQQAARAALG
ncbi:MAG: hypothetical protein ACK4FW_08460, partial [Stenotrophomonas sp.]